MRRLPILLAAVLAPALVDADEPTRRPNVLVLMADDWSWPHAGFLGDRTVRTPHLDALAERGVVFENAFVSSPSCTPSRFAVATGQWHWRLGEAANLGGSLAENVPVYAELLAEAGYHVGRSRKGAAPSKHVHTGRDPLGPRFQTFDAFLEKRGEDQPFCFWYGAGEPHRPYRAGTGVKRGLDPESVRVPACLPDDDVVRADLCDYYAAVERFDRDCGRMLKLLETIGERENTLVVLAGDNGMPFPRCKATLYDTGTRVPLVVDGPGVEHRGRRVTDFVNLTDLAPTILEAAGIDVPEAMTGRSLRPQLVFELSGRVDPSRSFTLTGMERHVYPYPARAIRTERFLYVRNLEPQKWPSGEPREPPPRIDFGDGSWPTFPGAFSFNVDPSPTKQLLLDHATDPEVAPYRERAFGRRPEVELYDLAEDPGQLRNVADQPAYEADRTRLGRQLEEALAESDDPRFPARSETSAARQPREGADGDRKPNVLFIAMDDLNDWVGCMGGHPQVKTPNLDRLAASGILFDNAHCAAPACNPSRTAVMTGLSPAKSGVYENRQKMRTILPDAELLPKYFSRHGYWSAGSGKILHYFIDADSWDDYFPEASKENPFPRTLYPEKRPVSLPRGGPWQYVETDWGPLDVTDEEFGGDWLVSKWVGEQLAKEHEKPFFLACGFYRPHEPWFVPKKYFDMFPLDEVQLPPGYKADDLADLPPAGRRRGPNRYFAHIRKHGQWRQGVQGYLASIAFADAMLGRVLDALENGPNADNTVVVLWSDHGWHLGEKQHWQKFTLWRAGTRVPLIVRVPEGTPGLPAGTRPAVCSKPVSLQSLFNTLTDLTGLPVKEGTDGPSLVPLLADPKADWDHLAATYLHDGQSVALSGERLRYIRYENGDEELYDVTRDPYEWHNLAGDAKHADDLKWFRERRPTKLAPLVKTQK